METFGSFMRGARERAGKKQTELAAELADVPGCKQASLSSMEGDLTIPNQVQEERIGDALYLTKAEREHWHGLICVHLNLSMQRKSEAAKASRRDPAERDAREDEVLGDDFPGEVA